MPGPVRECGHSSAGSGHDDINKPACNRYFNRGFAIPAIVHKASTIAEKS